MSSRHEFSGSDRQYADASREAYVAEVTRSLALRLSPLELYEAQTEIRNHLVASAAAYEEIGLDAGPAMSAAIEKFGNPANLRRELAASAPIHISESSLLRMLLTLAGSAQVGLLLMILADQVLVKVGQVSQADPVLDLVVGGCAGIIAGVFARFATVSPLKFGFYCAIGAVGALYCVVMRGRPVDQQEVVIIATIALLGFLTGVGARRIARWEQRCASQVRPSRLRGAR
jgi:hypothetical protein